MDERSGMSDCGPKTDYQQLPLNSHVLLNSISGQAILGPLFFLKSNYWPPRKGRFIGPKILSLLLVAPPV